MQGNVVLAQSEWHAIAFRDEMDGTKEGIVCFAYLVQLILTGVESCGVSGDVEMDVRGIQ